MSLILEALKKSEAERRLGQVPGLMTPVQRTAPRERSLLPLLVVVVVLLAGTGAFGWWWLQQTQPSEPVPTAAQPVPTPAPATVPATPTPMTDAPPVPPALPATAPAPTRETPALPAPLPSDPEFDSTERESRPIAADTRALAPAPRDPPPRVATEPAPASVPPPPAPIVSPPPAPVAAPVAAPAPAPVTTAPAPDVASAPAPAPEEQLEYLPRINDLTPGERDGLPPLKLSMHVYAATPAARFVVVDGQRATEGARLSAAVTLQEIRRDGAVLLIDGRRILLPRL